MAHVDSRTFLGTKERKEKIRHGMARGFELEPFS
jgi:hypothetical protein